MKKSKVVRLPKHDDFIRRLQGVKPDAHLSDLYTIWATKGAGKKRNALGILFLLTEGIADYRTAADLHGAPLTEMFVRIPAYAIALVDDEEVKEVLESETELLRAIEDALNELP